MCYIQAGGRGSASDKFFLFHADVAGTLIVTASGTNTNSRYVYVRVNDDDPMKAEEPCTSTTRNEYSFDIDAGDIYIK